MALPAATDFTGSSITEAQFKTAMTTLRSYLSGLLGDAGTIPGAQAALDVIFGAGVDAKTGAYTLSTGDRGKLLNCTGTWTLSLPEAVTAGAGFCVALRNSGAGVITIDPSGAETVDGASTIALAASSSSILVCTGAAWVTVGTSPVITVDSIGAVKRDHGHNNVGSLCFAGFTAPASYSLSPGSTIAGSSLFPASVAVGTAVIRFSGATLSGTWRLLGYMYNADTGSGRQVASLFQRIS